MNNRFELEQQILACWSICDDLDVLMEAVGEKELSVDDICNALLGLKTMQNLKFDKLFSTFEQMIREGKCS